MISQGNLNVEIQDISKFNAAAEENKRKDNIHRKGGYRLPMAVQNYCRGLQGKE
jgi:hypothetical protein